MESLSEFLKRKEKMRPRVFSVDTDRTLKEVVFEWALAYSKKVEARKYTAATRKQIREHMVEKEADILLKKIEEWLPDEVEFEHHKFFHRGYNKAITDIKKKIRPVSLEDIWNDH